AELEAGRARRGRRRLRGREPRGIRDRRRRRRLRSRAAPGHRLRDHQRPLPGGEMTMEVIPSFLAFTSVQELERYDGQAFGNYLLRPGEVKKVIYPEDPGNLSGFIEYDVWVQHRENNTAVSLIYHNCLSNNPLAGLAD